MIFFERFCNFDNLSKAELIDFPSTIYLAAYTYEEFKGYEENLTKINENVEAAFWPLLNESNWVSPFAYRYELENLISELEKNKGNKKLRVLLDIIKNYT